MRLLVTSTVVATLWGMPQTAIQQPDSDLTVYSAVQELPDLTPPPEGADDEGPTHATAHLTPPPDDADNEGPTHATPRLTPPPDDADNEGPTYAIARLTPPPDDADNEGPTSA